MNDALIKREALIKRIDDVLDWEQNMGHGDGFRANLLRDCRAELTKKYVPMTEDEITESTKVLKSDLLHEPTLRCWKAVEAEVIRRAGLELSSE